GLVHLLDGRQAADARAGDHAEAVAIDLLKVDAGILHRVHARGDAVVHELVHAPRLLGRQVLLEVEVLHGAAEAAREVADVEARDGGDATDAVDDVVPGGGHRAAHRGDDAKTCYDYATLAQ